MADVSIETHKDAAYEVGTWVGRRQAFATLAGSCSAADAECLRQVRDERKYRALGMNWEEFCQKRIGINRKSAEKIIRRLEEFGPQYFTLAQVTGVTSEEYRRIADSVGAQGLNHAGESIAITAENAPKLIEAVKELRNQAAPAESKAAPEDHGRALDKGERLFSAAVTELERLHAMRLDAAERDRLTRILIRQLRRLSMVQLTEFRIPA